LSLSHLNHDLQCTMLATRCQLSIPEDLKVFSRWIGKTGRLAPKPGRCSPLGGKLEAI
jgi:hypothetical protein